jgi:RNAse (barnase) inhibitor barstar
VTDLLSRIVSLEGAAVLRDSISEPERLEFLIEKIRMQGFHVGLIDGRNTEEQPREHVLSMLEAEFHFPDYFGRNWDAVDECIRDLSWLPAKGYCCILRHASELKRQDQRTYKMLLDVLSDASNIWRREGKRFCLLIAESVDS